MKRLLNKKGFSLVELLVVIAIIAIILAIIIPNLSTGSSHEQEARENARAFYSNVQQAMVQEKFNETLLNDDSTKNANKKYTLIYAEVTTVNGTQSKVQIAFTDDDLKAKTTPAVNFSTLTEYSNAEDKLYEFSETIKKLLQTNKHDGYYYALVDDKYRVVSTYYSMEGKIDDLNGATFKKDFRAAKSGGSEYIVGAYPYSLSFEGREVFVDPNV